MKISIIIPTHNRADSLKEAIESIIALTGEAAFEVVAVDNNSTDHTKQVAESYGNIVKYVFEGRTAFSRARRTGADNASGDILLYIDDDVLLRPGALRNIAEVFAKVPDCGIIAGKIDPKFTKTPPDWTLACNQSFNGWSLYNPETYSFLGNDFTEVPSAAGPMMAIRQSVFKQVGGFPPDTIGVETNVGQRTFKKLYIGPGDYGLCLKTQAAGFKVYYSPDIACYHVIPDIRFTIGFWRSRMVGEGHYTAIANRGFFNLSENRIFIENKRAQIKYFQIKHRLLEKAKMLEKSHPRNLESIGMLPEELWIYYYAAYLEMDWVLRKYPDLWEFLWKIGAEGVDDNNFEYVTNHLPAEYEEIIGADVIKDLSPVNSISTYERLMDNLRHEVKRECEGTDSIINDVYQLLQQGSDKLNALDMFIADGQIGNAIRVLDSVHDIDPSNQELGSWITALKAETSAGPQNSEPVKPAGKAGPSEIDTAKSKQPPGDGNKKEVQTSEELIFQRATSLKDKGKADMDAESFSTALKNFDEAMYLCPQLPYLQRFRAVCLAALHRKCEAVFAACAALSQQPDDALMLNVIVKNLHISTAEVKMSPAQSLQLLDRIVGCAGFKISGLQYLRALCLIALSRLAEASTALEQEIRLKPDDGSFKALLDKTKDALQYETRQHKISSPKAVSKASQVLPLESINWIVDSRLDPIGRVFSHEGEIYRAVYPNAAQKVKHLFESNLIHSLVEKRLLVESQITDLKVPGFGLVLHHKRIPFISKAEEWPRRIFLDAAKTVIKINLELLKFGYATIDYHSHNVQQYHNAIPVWMDFGSIVAQDQFPTLHMHIEFNEWFAHYLILLSKFSNLERACRALMSCGGISIEEFQSLTGMKVDVPVGTDMQTWLYAAFEWLENIRFPEKQTQWGNYYSEGEPFRLPDPNADSFKKPNTRTGIVYDLISKYRPRKVIDIGCNAGLFSVLATHSGAEVCAIDYDEESLEVFYEALCKETRSLPISIIQRNIGNAEHQRRRPLKGDFAMALAVTHHMFLTQKYSFNNIAYILSSYSTDSLLTEFMPDGLGIGAPVPNPLPEEYTIENMKKSLRPYFRHIEEIEYPSGKSRRIFILCKERTSLNELIVTPS